ncbi:MAG: hypothetical protein JNM56_25190 [Planctomycetia bacterium]|nr:hypothetical protein [Planctomycetia bacterium]
MNRVNDSLVTQTPSEATTERVLEVDAVRGEPEQSAAASGATPSVAQQPTLTPDEEAFVGEMEKIWHPHVEQDLQARHRLGRMLNDRFGVPPNEQERGKQVLARAAQRLGTSTGELSRMRSFARHFKSHDEFQAKYPTVKSWSAVKELLAALNNPGAAEGGRLAKPKKATKAMLFESMSKSINTLKTVQHQLTHKELGNVYQLVDEMLVFVEELAAPLQKPSRPERGTAA